MKNKIKKIYIPILIFCLLLTGMAYFDEIMIKIFDIDLDKLSKGMTVLLSFLLNLIFISIMFLIYQDTLSKDFKKFIKNFSKEFETAFKYYFIGLLVMLVSNFVIAIFFSSASANNEEAVRSLIDLYPIYMIFSVSIYAPFIEELIFRKSIKDCFLSYKKSKLNKILYIATSGLIFASLHVLGMVTSNLDYLYIIPYLALGISFAALYVKTDNIFSSMSMHCLHNTVATILLLIAGV